MAEASTAAPVTDTIAAFGCRECKVVPTDFPDTGRGMGCAQPVKCGEHLLRIPLVRCWTSSGASACPEIAELLPDLPEMLQESDAVLISLHLLIERAKGSAAEQHHRAHIELLPVEVETLLSWSDEDLEALSGSKWHMVAKACRNDILQEFGELAEAVGIERLQKLGVDAEGYLWAQKILLSRALKFHQGDDEPPLEALIPLHDMFNHGGEVRNDDVRLERSEDGELCITVYAMRDYAEGEQAWCTYSPSSNGRLLMGCGFILEENPYDCVELTLTVPSTSATLSIFRELAEACNVEQLAPGAPISADALEALEFVELPEEDSENKDVVVHFRLTKDKPLGEQHLLPFLRLGMATAAGAVLDQTLVDKLQSGHVLSAAHERKALSVLRGAIEGMLAGYPRTLDQDEEIINQLPSNNERFKDRSGKALHVVMAEKRLLHSGLAALDDRISAL